MEGSCGLPSGAKRPLECGEPPAAPSGEERPLTAKMAGAEDLLAGEG